VWEVPKEIGCAYVDDYIVCGTKAVIHAHYPDTRGTCCVLTVFTVDLHTAPLQPIDQIYFRPYDTPSSVPAYEEFARRATALAHEHVASIRELGRR